MLISPLWVYPVVAGGLQKGFYILVCENRQKFELKNSSPSRSLRARQLSGQLRQARCTANSPALGATW